MAHEFFVEKEQGLTSLEAKKRIARFGPNSISSQKRKTLFVSFIAKFTNPLIIILLAASFISAFTRDIANFLIILFIILLSVLVDVYQEYQSEKAVEKLQQKVIVKATVLRDNQKKEIPISQVTVGDLVFLAAGDVVPADIEITSVKDLHIDESSLTGESFPSEKQVSDTVYLGTTVVNGEATGIVQHIGKDTQFGKIADKLTLKRPETDFEKGIKQFSMLIVRLTLLLVIIIFFVNALLKQDIFDSLLFSLALAVGLTPELLPMIVTLNLAKGATRMAKKGVIVKHLPSIQNFGSMNVLCTDKTGTLTENKIQLERYENVLGKEDKRVLEYAYLNSFFQSNIKNPLDDAILTHTEVKKEDYVKIDEVPFDFIRKRLSVVVKNHKHLMLTCKGAPLTMWQLLAYYDNQGKIMPIDTSTKEKLEKRYNELSAQGFRVLTVAYRILSHDTHTYTKDDEKDLTFLGFTAFLDPPKKDVKDVLQSLTKEGITIKILTGDSEIVTKKICTELSIPIQGVVIGEQLIHITDDALLPLVLHANIFARLTPDQKDHIIAVLKKAKFVVGFLGDGVNDAVSLRTADIGISVDNAVDVAKESADIILVTKSLHVLRDGIFEGRTTFTNTMKYIFMGTGSNFGNMFSVSIASLFLPFIPMLPIQILLNNLIYDMSQIALATDHVDKNDIQTPRSWDMHFLKRFILTFGPISSIFDIVTFAILLSFFNASIPFFRTGWFIESAVTQSLIIFSVRTKKVPFFTSSPSRFLVVTAVVAALFAIVISQTSLGTVFSFVPLPFSFWFVIIGITLCYFLVVEFAKIWFYKLLSKKTPISQTAS